MTFTSALAEVLAPDVLERFLRYVRVDTQSSPDSGEEPSTPGQLDLGRLLVDELQQLGLDDAAMDDGGFVFATLPGTGPTVGLLAHVDTTPEVAGAGVEPLVHRGYGGGAIELPLGGTVLDPAAMPVLAGKAGHDIVTSSGDTLLGADDKAGVAEIMAAVAHLAAHPELPRPTVRVGFTPDEEIGLGATRFDIERFGATCAYTLDGSQPGELQDETLLRRRHHRHLPGRRRPSRLGDRQARQRHAPRRPLPGRAATRAHPGSDARPRGVRARLRGRRDDREGADQADRARLRRRPAGAARLAGAPDGGGRSRPDVDVDVKPQYSNMRRHLEAFPDVVERAARAIRAEGLEVVRVPIRGGTDGSILSARGLPTPNLFTGGHEYHSTREWASVQDMASAAAVVVRLTGEWAVVG